MKFTTLGPAAKAAGHTRYAAVAKAGRGRPRPVGAVLVPAVNQMFATTSSLALVIGCTSYEAASVVPIINAHKMAMFCMTGQSQFDHVQYPYFYRLVPPDLEESYAMVAIAQELHYKRIAPAFGNDIRSQTFLQPAISALKKAGIPLTTNQSLDLKATTFRTEAEAIIQSHPDAIMTEALGYADPTLLSQVRHPNAAKPTPIIATTPASPPRTAT